MGKQIWLQDGNIFSQGSSTTVSHPEGLPKGIYEVKLSMTGFYLSKLQSLLHLITNCMV